MQLDRIVPKGPFLDSAGPVFRWVYDHATSSRLPAWFAARTSTCETFDDPSPECKARRAAYTDILVISRLVIAVLALVLSTTGWVLPQILAGILAAFLTYDVVTAHVTHFLDETAGSAGRRARWSNNRSLVIAAINIAVLVTTFAVGYALIDRQGLLASYSTSAAVMTAQGFFKPVSAWSKRLALGQTVVAIFMLAAVVTTILQSLPARDEIDRGDSN